MTSLPCRDFQLVLSLSRAHTGAFTFSCHRGLLKTAAALVDTHFPN